MSETAVPFVPPYPAERSPPLAFLRMVARGDGDLLSLMPGKIYRMKSGYLGLSRRSTVLFNDPDDVRAILNDPGGVFPKSDLMVNALEPLIGDSVFTSDGDTWRRQRAMIDPAFSHMRLSVAFAAMRAAVDDSLPDLRARADSGELISLDQAMGHVTADVICRSVFSVSLQSEVARDVFEDFAVFESDVAQVRFLRLVFDPAWKKVPQKPGVLAACARIRQHIGALIDTHLAAAPGTHDDIASAVIASRDAETGEPFTREELIDQLGVFFLAGHKTTASALTWLFFVLATRPELMARLRAEIDDAGELGAGTLKALPFTRALFREALRLYPPITFMPRVALRDTEIGGTRVRRGAIVMISPWSMHRHYALWDAPHRFDPDRFMPDREKQIVPGSFIPFGAGPHICIGAGFAQLESALILAEFARAFDFEIEAPHRVRPVAHLTTRPASEIRMRVRHRR
jgi:cytochrome P450